MISGYLVELQRLELLIKPPNLSERCMFSSDGAQSKRGSRVLLQTNCTLVRQRLCPGTAPQNSKNVFRLVPRPSASLDLLTFMLNFLQYFNRL